MKMVVMPGGSRLFGFALDNRFEVTGDVYYHNLIRDVKREDVPYSHRLGIIRCLVNLRANRDGAPLLPSREILYTLHQISGGKGLIPQRARQALRSLSGNFKLGVN